VIDARWLSDIFLAKAAASSVTQWLVSHFDPASELKIREVARMFGGSDEAELRVCRHSTSVV